MLDNQILTDEEIKDGLVLTCQSIPSSDNITIDYDEVWFDKISKLFSIIFLGEILLNTFSYPNGTLLPYTDVGIYGNSFLSTVKLCVLGWPHGANPK